MILGRVREGLPWAAVSNIIARSSSSFVTSFLESEGLSYVNFKLTYNVNGCFHF